MTGRFCSTCGAERAPGASFCAGCGAAVAAAPPEQPPAPATGEWVAAQSPPPAAAEYAAPPQYAPPPVPPQPQYAPPPVPPQPQYVPQAESQPQFQGAPAQPWNAAQPTQVAQPTPAPWGAVPVGAPARTASGRSVVDALLTGDWGRAARTAGLAVGVMLAISLVGVLLITEGGVGFQETVALVFAGVCLAVGGDAFAEADAESFGTSFSVGLLPLTVTLVGLGLLGWSFARHLRTTRFATATDALLHGVRTTLVFTAIFLPLALLTRYTTEQGNVIGLSGRVGVGVFSTIIGAFLFAVAALGLTWLFSSVTPMPARVSAFRDKARAPLFGAVVVFSVGLLAVLAGLVYGLVEGNEPMIQIGATVLVAGNAALASVLWSAGVPMNIDGTASSSVLGQFTPTGSQSVDLFTYTDLSGWFWLAPLVLLATTVLVATALAVRQNTVEDARREGIRFAGALAVVAFVATLLLRIGVDGEAASEFQAQASADGSMMFNPLFAAVVLGVWGAATGLLAPVVATKIGSGFVAGVRRRFGTAEPMQPVA